MLTTVQSVDVSHANMMLRAFTASLLFLLCSGAEMTRKDWCRITCRGIKHTMCEYPEVSDSCVDYEKGLNQKEKQLLVHLHNMYRAKVARGEETRAKEGISESQPSATDMYRLRWDEELATVAQRWANQRCDVFPDPKPHDDCRSDSKGVLLGQNVEVIKSGAYIETRITMIQQSMKDLYDEVDLMDPSWVEEFNLETMKEVGHYTQMMWGKTTRVGCGMTFMDPEKNPENDMYIKLVCNYKEPGNVEGQRIYTDGETAADCREESNDYPGLCEPDIDIIEGLDDPPQDDFESDWLSSDYPDGYVESGDGSSKPVNWCNPGLSCARGGKVYQHTMCTHKEGGAASCNQDIVRGVREEEKHLLVHLHNLMRSRVATGQEKRGTPGPQLKAADMFELRWDEELATVAQRWADQCQVEDLIQDYCRLASDRTLLNQNVAGYWIRGKRLKVDRFDLIKRTMKFMYEDEVRNMDRNLVKSIKNVNKRIFRYTQLVWAKTTRVGCGLALKKQEDGEFVKIHIKLVCNYKESGNMIGMPIYIEGEPAADCQEKSEHYEGLCSS